MLGGVMLALLAATPGAEKPRLIVLELSAQAGVEHEAAVALTDAVAAEVDRRGFFQATSPRDLQTLIGVERQRQLIGCADEGACMTELAGAIGARYVMNGAIARLGDAFQLSLQTLDTQKATPLGRSIRLAKNISTLREQLAYAVAEATATPLPPAPSHLLSYSLTGAGGALVVAGGVVGLYAISQESLVQSEINQGQQLKGYAYYAQARAQYGVDRSVALAGMLAGAALVGVGLYLNPDFRLGAAAVAVVPSAGGGTLVVRWP